MRGILSVAPMCGQLTWVSEERKGRWQESWLRIFAQAARFEVVQSATDTLTSRSGTALVACRSHDPEQPLVGLDETSKQLVAETRMPAPMQPGQPRHDYEYERPSLCSGVQWGAVGGTANMFIERRNETAHGEETRIGIDDLDDIANRTLGQMRAFGSECPSKTATAREVTAWHEQG